MIKQWAGRLLHSCLMALVLLPAAAIATQYPLTVKDIDGRTVVLNHEPQHIILQDGRDLMALALLDRDNPFHRVIAWNNLLKKQDEQTCSCGNEEADVRSLA